MVPADVRAAVEDLRASIEQRPTELPLGQILALRGTGYDVHLDRGERPAVVWVQPRPDDRLADLSPREREVALLAAAGSSNQQIAVALCISLATAKDHMHSILSKTGLRSRSQLIAAWYGGLDRADTVS
ncbi:MAG: helix-turn-helix transcriptional regulator [Actinomycetota bacterium]